MVVCPAQFAHHSSLNNQQSAKAFITAGLVVGLVIDELIALSVKYTAFYHFINDKRPCH